MKVIQLTRGHVTVVDDDQFEKLAQYRWHTSGSGYAIRFVGGRKNHRIIHIHREIFGTVPDGMEIDHINMNRMDNRRENLRLATRQQNRFNQNVRIDNKLRLKGINYIPSINKYRARISMNGATKDLGCHQTVEGAIMAHRLAAEELHGKFARSNDAQGI